ncbi:ectonucleotide pyrophosphatase/phosphodiesterase family member 3 isoform X1 [Exaiptasia diaphana]|nr:ectonucleotide pyrophosphatase/phosphodiesterase family member 3 isoform X1 [Exaiptasia diaphana]
MDGFKDTYIDKGFAPNIQKLAKEGVRARFLISQFPTKTFPNHYSIVTGLYPVHHGIVSNSFYDPKLKEAFGIGKPTSFDPKWWKGEPLWQAAMKNDLVTASYFFVGSEIPIEGMLPNFTFIYNQSHPFETRVDTVLSWLDLPRQGSQVDPEHDDGRRRPDFITLYFHQPDKAGHINGPESEQVKNSTRLVDRMIGRLYEGLRKRSLMDKVNVIMLSDHGMAATDCKRKQVTYLDQYGVTLNDIMTSQYYGGAFMSLNPRGSLNKSEILSRIQCKSRYLRVFAKEDLPKRLHYSSSSRIGEIVIIPQDGWLIGTNSSIDFRCLPGNHGYDPMDASMRSMFVAHGPSFKKGLIHDPFVNTEIYNMIAGLLEIKPVTNDGTPGSLNLMLKTETPPLPLKGDGKEFQTCSYPGDNIAAKRRQCKDCVCPYCDLGSSPDKVKHLDEKLDLSNKQILDYQQFNLPWGLPDGGAGNGGCILTQQEYITGFSTYLRVPLWVGYRLDGEKANQKIPRQNCFRRDIRLNDAQASDCNHYIRSGMDRGHMVPNADFDYNETAALNTFILSNVAPQYHIFNTGDWAFLETYVRSLAIKFNIVYVISGAIFDKDADGMRDTDASVTSWLKDKPNTVAIPTHFYKIVVRCNVSELPFYKVPGCNGRLDVISFILPHKNEKHCYHQSRQDYLLDNTATVRDVERLTGSVFFNRLPSLEQARLKTFYPLELW